MRFQTIGSSSRHVESRVKKEAGIKRTESKPTQTALHFGTLALTGLAIMQDHHLNKQKSWTSSAKIIWMGSREPLWQLLEKADQAKQQDYYRFPEQKLNASRIPHSPEKIMISKTGSFSPKGQFRSSSVFKSYVHFPSLTMRSVLGSKRRSRSHYTKWQKLSHKNYTGMLILGGQIFNILYLDKVF